MTLREALQLGHTQLASSGLSYPKEDALVILGLVLKCSRIRLVTRMDSTLGGPDELLFRRLIELRKNHFPIQYMSGEQEFYGRSFRVRPGVLIPRAETELVVEKTLELAAGIADEAISILDIGTGSGCIAVSLACEEPRIRVTAIEPSPVALQVAKFNCRRHACRERVTLVCCELRNCPDLGRFQLIVSNPPYLNPDESAQIDPSVLHYEPRQALFGETGRLSVFREIFESAAESLAAGGSLLLELGHDQLEDVSRLGQDNGWVIQAAHRDLAGWPRVGVFGRQI